MNESDDLGDEETDDEIDALNDEAELEGKRGFYWRNMDGEVVWSEDVNGPCGGGGILHCYCPSLAPFEALAREADMNRQMAGPGTEGHAVDILARLAALAGPEGAGNNPNQGAAPAQPFDVGSETLLARLGTLTADELRATLRDFIGQRDALARELLAVRQGTA